MIWEENVKIMSLKERDAFLSLCNTNIRQSSRFVHRSKTRTHELIVLTTLLCGGAECGHGKNNARERKNQKEREMVWCNWWWSAQRDNIKNVQHLVGRTVGKSNHFWLFNFLGARKCLRTVEQCFEYMSTTVFKWKANECNWCGGWFGSACLRTVEGMNMTRNEMQHSDLLGLGHHKSRMHDETTEAEII